MEDAKPFIWYVNNYSTVHNKRAGITSSVTNERTEETTDVKLPKISIISVNAKRYMYI